ncbi:MAG: DeoR family transcriptional regulator [Patescibacteria group bacterium]|nr:DeoR family transcriptional regulator [Patescibacteria group bacterium]MDE1945084.1 DeoR family transcriptional regulator [Patescibacteria group bacterium]MDE2057253.1 DeoR family transcriptional regulator [Patescibacteria group bacterium]
MFSNIFYKDIRRVYIYKKAERLASALYLVGPAFAGALSLRAKLEGVALALTEAAQAPAPRLAEALSRELLALSSLLSMARAGGLLSPMNAELIAAEARALLAEAAGYEEPRLALPEAATLPALARELSATSAARPAAPRSPAPRSAQVAQPHADKGHASPRQEAILSYITDKGTVSIRDLSFVVRGVSEKTIQRELQTLIGEGRVLKRGERRWSTYELSR